jgi:hypothetical protein
MEKNGTSELHVSNVGRRIGEFNADIDVVIIRAMEIRYLRYRSNGR